MRLTNSSPFSKFIQYLFGINETQKFKNNNRDINYEDDEQYKESFTQLGGTRLDHLHFMIDDFKKDTF